eukprot:NODE_1642_length_1430_cov_24.333845_g1559_i0.p1 GENE.NODE_1642_length_1430_cov_24.333845_g1559_i0~~NODE_1642_length_1430_cov_24.333845_g1559_i0.p1  ORF type:complete len:447 (-),score=96.27 NODE_1642_length_1430_cov_24.333845_g1559_i0:89-1393(-)
MRLAKLSPPSTSLSSSQQEPPLSPETTAVADVLLAAKALVPPLLHLYAPPRRAPTGVRLAIRRTTALLPGSSTPRLTFRLGSASMDWSSPNATVDFQMQDEEGDGVLEVTAWSGRRPMGTGSVDLYSLYPLLVQVGGVERVVRLQHKDRPAGMVELLVLPICRPSSPSASTRRQNFTPRQHKKLQSRADLLVAVESVRGLTTPDRSHKPAHPVILLTHQRHTERFPVGSEAQMHTPATGIMYVSVLDGEVMIGQGELDLGILPDHFPLEKSVALAWVGRPTGVVTLKFWQSSSTALITTPHRPNHSKHPTHPSPLRRAGGGKTQRPAATIELTVTHAKGVPQGVPSHVLLQFGSEQSHQTAVVTTAVWDESFLFNVPESAPTLLQLTLYTPTDIEQGEVDLVALAALLPHRKSVHRNVPLSDPGHTILLMVRKN